MLDNYNNISVLSVGNGEEQIYSINIAKSMGCNVIAVGRDINHDIPSNILQYQIDIKDADKVLEIAKKYNIKAILPAPIGRYVTTIGYINEKLNLIGPKAYATTICADKQLLNSILMDDENSFNLAKQISSNSSKLKEQLGKSFTFPIIIKPRYGSGSNDVLIVHSSDEALSYIKNYKASHYGELIIEEFLGDPNIDENIKEIGVDVVIVNSEIVFINLRDKLLTTMPYRQEIQYISPSSVSDIIKERVRQYINKIADKLLLKDCIIHADIMLVNNTPYMIEISPRPAGLNIINKLTPVSIGKDIISEFIKYQLGEKFDFTYNNTKKYSLLRYIDIENISINNDLDIDKLKDNFDIDEVDILIKKGGYLDIVSNGHQLLSRGYYIISDISYEKLVETNIEVLNYIKREAL